MTNKLEDPREPTQDGRRLIEEYISHEKKVRMVQEQLDRMKDDLKESTKKLCKWLAPKDMKTGEKIGMWINFDNSGSNFQRNFVQIALVSANQGEPVYEIEIRYRS